MLKIAAVILLLLEILLIKEATFQEENALFMTLCIPIKNTTYIFHLVFPRLVLEQRKFHNK